MPVLGGPAQRICEADTPTGIDWRPSGIILFGQGAEGHLARVGETVARPKQVATVEAGRRSARAAAAAGRRSFPVHDRDRARARSLGQGRHRRPVSQQPERPQAARHHWQRCPVRAPGYLVYAVSGTPVRHQVRSDSLEVRGDLVLVQEEASVARRAPSRAPPTSACRTTARSSMFRAQLTPSRSRWSFP